MSKYDLLVVGAGLFGATIACNANRTVKKVLVIDRRNSVGFPVLRIINRKGIKHPLIKVIGFA